MNGAMWIKYLNEGVSFCLLVGMAWVLYRGLKKNQAFLSEREELLKRYLLFRGDIQVRLKVYGEDEKTYQELLKNLSESWKNFKKTYDEYLLSLSRNTVKIRRLLFFLALALFANSARLLVETHYFFSLQHQFFYILSRELSNYVLVILGFLLLRSQTHRFVSLKGETAKMEREILFYSNSLSEMGERGALFDEFAPIENEGGSIGRED